MGVDLEVLATCLRRAQRQDEARHAEQVQLWAQQALPPAFTGEVRLPAGRHRVALHSSELYGTSPLSWAWPTLWATPIGERPATRWNATRHGPAPRYLVIPKAASTAVRHALDKAAGMRARNLLVYYGLGYSANGSAPVKGPKADIATPKHRFNSTAVASGGGPVSRQWRDAFAFTFVREPLARLHSQFLWFCRAPPFDSCNTSKAEGQRAFDSFAARLLSDPGVPCRDKLECPVRGVWYPFVDEHYAPQWRFLLNTAHEAEAAGGRFDAPFHFIGHLSSDDESDDWAALKEAMRSRGVDGSRLPPTLAWRNHSRLRASSGSLPNHRSFLSSMLSPDTLALFCAAMAWESACLGFELPAGCPSVALKRLQPP